MIYNGALSNQVPQLPASRSKWVGELVNDIHNPG